MNKIKGRWKKILKNTQNKNKQKKKNHMTLLFLEKNWSHGHNWYTLESTLKVNLVFFTEDDLFFPELETVWVLEHFISGMGL